MEELLKIRNKTIYDIDTTILFTSSFNYNNDAIELLNKGCIVISKTSHGDISEIPDVLLNMFDCYYLKTKAILTKIDEYKINILASLNSPNYVYVFLNILTYVEKDFQNKVIKFLKENNKRIVNYTSEIEETNFLDYLIIIHNNEVIMEGKTKEVLQVEKIIKKLGFSLPFIVELSSGLKYYGVVDRIYFDNESLVDDLWK